MDDVALQQNQELARESSRRLTLLFADQTEEFSKEALKCQIVEFHRASGSKDVKKRLADFMYFLCKFGKAKWLGSMVAPEFMLMKHVVVQLLGAMQNPTKTTLPQLHTSRCGQCGKETLKSLGFCDECNKCAHGYQRSSYPQGCPSGCNTSHGFFPQCTRCGQAADKTMGFCNSCNQCQHGHQRNSYPQGCPLGCRDASGPASYCSQCGEVKMNAMEFCGTCNECMHGYDAKSSPEKCPQGCKHAASLCSKCQHFGVKTLGFCPHCKQCAHGNLSSSCPQGCPQCKQQGGGAVASYCNQCGNTTKKKNGFCVSCKSCAHGYKRFQHPGGCPSGCAQKTGSYCNQCGSMMVNKGVCANCNYCQHGYCMNQYPQGCPSGCMKVLSTSIKEREPAIYGEIVAEDCSTAEQLTKLAQMAEAFAASCRADAAARAAAEVELQNKWRELKIFAEVMQEVPEVFRRFLLVRIGSMQEDLNEVKECVSYEEATAVQQMLEKFRDEANEEKVMRRVQAKMGLSSGSSWIVASSAPSEISSQDE